MLNQFNVSRGERLPMWSAPNIDEMFERALRDPFSLFEDLRPTVVNASRWVQPSMEVEETEHAFMVNVDLPGVKKEDIKIELSENMLTISGERNDKQKSQKSYSRFERSFTVPSSVDVEKVEASLEDGVLRIALPKSEKAKPRMIEISSGKGTFLLKSDKQEANSTH